MAEIKINFLELKQTIERALKLLDLDAKQSQLDSLQEQMSAPDFWQDQNLAKSISSAASQLEKQIKQWREIDSQCQTLYSLLNNADEDTQLQLAPEVAALQKNYETLSQQIYLNGPHDQASAIVTINAGAGGVDAGDWAAMLERMYLRYSEKNNWSIHYLARSVGGEAGIKSVTFEVAGLNAYGYLKNEKGVHRLVRLSPYDADHARHTSFAMVEVLPEMNEVEINLKEEEIRVDTYRSSGHGGQSVNTTDSAVRLTHLPTGLTAMCQNERSQMQNKRQAMIHLASKVQLYYEAKQEAERQALRGEYTEAAWGNQIRSYVLHPYKMVKDHRTNYESSDPEAVLDGDLNDFIKANLEKQFSQS